VSEKSIHRESGNDALWRFLNSSRNLQLLFSLGSDERSSAVDARECLHARQEQSPYVRLPSRHDEDIK
jgi:hypothetical protein